MAKKSKNENFDKNVNKSNNIQLPAINSNNSNNSKNKTDLIKINKGSHSPEANKPLAEKAFTRIQSKSVVNNYDDNNTNTNSSEKSK